MVADDVDSPSEACLASAMNVQGGAIRTYPFDPSVDSVQVLLNTDSRPLNPNPNPNPNPKPNPNPNPNPGA